MGNLEPNPSLTERLAFATLALDDVYWFFASRKFPSMLSKLQRVSPLKMDRLSRLRSRRAYYHALRTVPAYRNYVSSLSAKCSKTPETDKAAYITQYSIEDRCCGGKIPYRTIMIDESSGSTGVPFNWVRSLEERADSHKAVNFFARYCYGEEETIVINAFSMGAWATGLNMGQALLQFSTVKNIGPDLDKILSTLQAFGTRYRYLVVGYPPFLKHLIDVSVQRGVSLEGYRLDALVGGEGMSEGLRDYLMQTFRSVFSGYGATDLELGLGGETWVSVAIRRLARDNLEIRELLFGDHSRLPMVFQYNPLMHYFEINSQSEVLVTILRSNVLSPRIRYNIHDEGGIARFDELEKLLATKGIDLSKLSTGPQPTLKLPFLWIYGRQDSTISIMGANIYPEDLEECVYTKPSLAKQISSFCMELAELDSGEFQACFHFEVETPTDSLQDEIKESVYKTLICLNSDFREAAKEHPNGLKPQVQLHRTKEGPFAQNSSRIKHLRKVNSIFNP